MDRQEREKEREIRTNRLVKSFKEQGGSAFFGGASSFQEVIGKKFCFFPDFYNAKDGILHHSNDNNFIMKEAYIGKIIGIRSQLHLACIFRSADSTIDSTIDKKNIEKAKKLSDIPGYHESCREKAYDIVLITTIGEILLLEIGENGSFVALLDLKNESLVGSLVFL